jgi:hypothetical protein
MKKLNFEQMEMVEGGFSFAAFACGFGIVTMLIAPESIPLAADATIAACAEATQS